MQIYALSGMKRIESLPTGCVAALGNFDGVHAGHLKLLSTARAVADELSASCAVWCFTELAKDGEGAKRLTTTDEKLRLFAEAGMDYALLEDFDSVCTMSAYDFALEYLPHRLLCSHVVCGFNFRFGCGATGDAALLCRLLKKNGITSSVVDAVRINGDVVSSTAIRAFVERGDMESARRFLTRPFFIFFPVIEGNRLGRTIGVPTINQDFPDGHIIPKRGIYAVTATVGEDMFLGVANVGFRPTVGGTYINCETHIINYNGLLYGKQIKVEFYLRLRDEIKFESVDGLRAQIKRDINAAVGYFSTFDS